MNRDAVLNCAGMPEPPFAALWLVKWGYQIHPADLFVALVGHHDLVVLISQGGILGNEILALFVME